MADETTKPAEAASSEDSGPVFAIQRIYLKDLSFETPMGPSVFQKQWQPKVNQDLNTKNTKLEDDLYEVALRLTLTVTDGEDTIYLLEVKQAGILQSKDSKPSNSRTLSTQPAQIYCSLMQGKLLTACYLRGHSLL